MCLCPSKKVRFPETTVCRAESSAKTWRERSDFSSCDRLDRKKTGARVPESLCHAKHGRCLCPSDALSHGPSLCFLPSQRPACRGGWSAVRGKELAVPVLRSSSTVGFMAAICSSPGLSRATASALCPLVPIPLRCHPAPIGCTACCKALTPLRLWEHVLEGPEVTNHSLGSSTKAHEEQNCTRGFQGLHSSFPLAANAQMVLFTPSLGVPPFTPRSSNVAEQGGVGSGML